MESTKLLQIFILKVIFISEDLIVDKTEILSGKPIFVGLSDPEIEHLASLTEEEKFPSNFNIVSENDLSFNIYIIVSGKVEIIKTLDENSLKTQRLTTLSAGDCFGEMSLIDIEPRSATVRTISETTVLKLSNENIKEFSKFSKDGFTLIILNIARILSRRLRKANSDLTQLTSKITN